MQANSGQRLIDELEALRQIAEILREATEELKQDNESKQVTEKQL